MSDWYKNTFGYHAGGCCSLHIRLCGGDGYRRRKKQTTIYHNTKIETGEIILKSCPTQISHQCGSSRYCRIKKKVYTSHREKKILIKHKKCCFLCGCLACIRQARRLHPGCFIWVLLQENPSRALTEPVCSPSSSSSSASLFLSVFSSFLWKTHFWQKYSVRPA